MIAVTPTQSDIQTALRNFLLAILPAGIEVIESQDNRVPEPVGPDFVEYTAIRRPRLATNIDDYADALFTGSIAGSTMTITAVAYGALVVGSTIFGVGVAAGTMVIALGTGTGGMGTYTVSPAQTISSEPLAAGVETLLQETEVVFQLDVHGPASADNVQIISTMFRDAYAVAQFATSGFDVTPLYADDPRQMAFVNENQQYENRWTVDCHLQCNQTISVPQQYFDVATVELVSVDASYPPS